MSLGFIDGPNGVVTPVALKSVAKAKIRSLAALRYLSNEIACLRHLTAAKASATAAAPARGGGAAALALARGLEHIVSLHSVRTSASTVYIVQSVGGSDLFRLMSHLSRDVVRPVTRAVFHMPAQWGVWGSVTSAHVAA